MRKALLSLILALVALTATAQERLIRVDSETTAWRKNSPRMAFFDNEKSRLLMPQGAAFGVECIPSFSSEWTLTYDSMAHALIYREAQKSIWHATYQAMHKKKKGKKHSKWVPRRRPKDYVPPEVKTFSLTVSDDQAATLREIWATAVHNAVEREVNILDGVKWEYFIDGQRAKTHSDKKALVKFTNQLAEAVWTGNAARKDSLISESQQIITHLQP